MTDRRGALEALQQMGRLARQHLDKPSQASHYFREALDLAVQMDDRAKQGKLLNTLGIMSRHCGFIVRSETQPTQD
ncbi:MAG: hypothetical protein O7G88_18295 [bacterium]|nr:hypothetical protein [bacterium]